MRPIDSLHAYENNARTHSPEQVEQIAQSIEEWGWTVPVLVDEDGMILAGHGRIEAAQSLGLEHVPVMVATGWDEPKKRAYIIADNKLALNAGWDAELLLDELSDLAGIDFSLELIGFTGEELKELEAEVASLNDELSDNYSRKIEPPIYRPTGDKPELHDLYDSEKTLALQAEIKSAKLPKGVKAFLMAAAERHTVFNFSNIAEYYAHASPELQELMERSALIIIDYDKAIEQGFVQTTGRMLEFSQNSIDKNYK